VRPGDAVHEFAEGDGDAGNGAGPTHPEFHPNENESPQRPETFAEHVIRCARVWEDAAQLGECECAAQRDHSAERPDEVHLPRMLRDRGQLARREEDPRAEHIADDERENR
jgi:hypothetical protein